VAFDEIRVVAVHLPDEVGHPLEDVGRVNLAGEATGGFQDVTGQLGQAGTPLLGQERLHWLPDADTLPCDANPKMFLKILSQN
jgi:hypothetical protein